jgi:hypothetical protein
MRIYINAKKCGVMSMSKWHGMAMALTWVHLSNGRKLLLLSIVFNGKNWHSLLGPTQ